MRSLLTLVLLVCLLALLPQSQAAAAGCPGGNCPTSSHRAIYRSKAVLPAMQLQPGEPVRNAARASTRAVVRVASVPVRATRAVVKAQPVRKGLRFMGRVLTGRGPILSAVRGKRGC